jgi:hypothetical protein
LSDARGFGECPECPGGFSKSPHANKATTRTLAIY